MQAIALASRIAFKTLSVCLRRPEDPNVHPLVHVYLVFLWALVKVEQAMRCIETYVPWNGICSFLSSLSTPSRATKPSLRYKDFPEPEKGPGRPLPEDYVMRGQLYSQRYFPEAWFADAMIDDDERSLETASMAEPRADRLFWLGRCIASVCPKTNAWDNVLNSFKAKKWICFDEEARLFSPTEYVTEMCGFSPTVSQPNQPDQSEVEARIEADPNDEDSAMEDVGNPVNTPRTSIAMSDSQDASEESTRASTPTENRAEDAPADIYTPKSLDYDDDDDDVTMRDPGPKIRSTTTAAKEVGTKKVVSWPSNAVIDPGSSPGQLGKIKEEFVDYDPDPHELEELFQTGDPDRPSLYKP